MANDIKDTAGCYEEAERFLREMFYVFLSERYTCMPCRVVAVNVDKQMVDIQPLLKTYYRQSGQSVSRPVIQDVPFWTFRAGDTYISLPIKPGDTGLAIFCQRDITNWKETGGEVPLQSERVMDYNDAFYIPFIGSAAQAISGYNAEYIEIVKNGKKITVKDGVLDAPEYHINCKSILATGLITSETDVIAGGISGKTHVHGGVQGGPSDTGVPK